MYSEEVGVIHSAIVHSQVTLLLPFSSAFGGLYYIINIITKTPGFKQRPSLPRGYYSNENRTRETNQESRAKDFPWFVFGDHPSN